MKKIFISIFLVFILNLLINAQTTSLNFTIRVNTTISENPPKITFSWNKATNATNYYIYKKDKTSASWGTPVIIPGSDSSYTDPNVEIGKGYEYRIDKIQNAYIVANCFIYTGIKFPATESRGTVLLLIDKNYSSSAVSQIQRLRLDLIGDGWKVTTAEINRTDSVQNVKKEIIAIKTANPDIRTVFLLGHIPVPWSGDFSVPPDGHVVGSGSHTDAWPADVYYADIDGQWSDWMINKQTAGRQIAWNVPGDGKFDQTSLPSDADLELGRVDLYDMPVFGLSDTQLIIRYLDKDHSFRMGEFNYERKGLVDDNFTTLTLASTGWLNQTNFWGIENVEIADYFTTLGSKSYLTSYGCGAGSFNSCSGIGVSSDFASKNLNTVFTMLAGSFFGDWDNTNALLRAPLGSQPSALVCFWGGIPNWFLHHMSMGENIGYSTKLTQNNYNDYPTVNFNYSLNEVHIALMGDPTLKLTFPEQVKNVKADSTGYSQIEINWNAWNGSQTNYRTFVGYNIYRARSLDGDFFKLNTEPISDTFYSDSKPGNGKNYYMVRAVFLEINNSGSFYNLSTGIIDSATTQSPWSVSEAFSLEVKAYPNPSNGIVYFTSSEKSSPVTIEIFNNYGQVIYYSNDFTGLGSLDFTEFGKGLYVIKATTARGSTTRKVIIR